MTQIMNLDNREMINEPSFINNMQQFVHPDHIIHSIRNDFIPIDQSSQINHILSNIINNEDTRNFISQQIERSMNEPQPINPVHPSI